MSWLPSFSVEVTHTPILGNGPRATQIQTSQLDNMVIILFSLPVITINLQTWLYGDYIGTLVSPITIKSLRKLVTVLYTEKLWEPESHSLEYQNTANAGQYFNQNLDSKFHFFVIYDYRLGMCKACSKACH